MVTERDLLILRAVARYYVLNREQIQRLVFPDDAHGRYNALLRRLVSFERALECANSQISIESTN